METIEEKTPHNQNMLEYIETKYKSHTDDPLCVYKMCEETNGRWLIIMRKITEESKTMTNETRLGVVDHMFAKFRANKLNVLEIVNTNDATTINSLEHSYRSWDVKSTVSYN